MSHASQEAEPSAPNPFDDQDDYHRHNPDAESTHIRPLSSDPFEDPEPAFTIIVQGCPDPSKAASDLNDLMQGLVPGTAVTLGNEGLAEIRLPDDVGIKMRSWDQLAKLSEQDDVCAIHTAAASTGNTMVKGNDTVFVVPLNTANKVFIHDGVGHWFQTEGDTGRLVLLPMDDPCAQTKATGSGTVSTHCGPDAEYSFASLQSSAWPNRWNRREALT
jgi:hypothetical protein